MGKNGDIEATFDDKSRGSTNKKSKKKNDEDEKNEEREKLLDPAAIAAELDPKFATSLANIDVRIKFVRKVLAAILCQLVLVIVCGVVTVFTPLKTSIAQVSYLIFICAGVLILILVFIILVKPCARFYPVNWFLFVIFTMCIVYINCYMLAAFWDETFGKVLFYLIIILAISFAVLLIFALSTKFDIGLIIGIIFVLAFGVLTYFFMADLVKESMVWSILLAIGITFFVYYIIWDLWMITGRMKRYKLDGNDWVLCAMHLYLDFFIIPFLVLELIHRLNKDDE